MSSTLWVQHTVCYRDQPLACVENLPGNFADRVGAKVFELRVPGARAGCHVFGVGHDQAQFGHGLAQRRHDTCPQSSAAAAPAMPIPISSET